MKTNSILKPVFLCWLIAGILLPVAAQVEKGTQNLYETAGKKQTNKDFIPASDKIETSFGTFCLCYN